MQPECYPIEAIPGTAQLFSAAVGAGPDAQETLLRRCYPTPAAGDAWLKQAGKNNLNEKHRAQLADMLAEQNSAWGADAAVLANIEKLRGGANAVVSGQQVTLFGGPLLTLLKAATAIRLAQEATAAGKPHVPIFWMASEDHDFVEVNHIAFPGKTTLETLAVAEKPSEEAVPVGRRKLGESVTAALEQAAALLGHAPVYESLAKAYTPNTTFADAFARYMHGIFAGHGLILIDASTRGYHALGAATLRGAITKAAELHTAMIARSKDLETAGFHAQVAVSENGSLLFLIDEKTGARQALRRSEAGWRAGAENYSMEELLAILEAAPERISANALLRPVFQDTLLPTSAYIGGPSEVAYFAQAQVGYEQLLGLTTPILPRLSATLVEHSIAHIMERYELKLPDLFVTPEELGAKLGARAMPIEGKKKLAAAGNTLERELTALTEWMHSLDDNLGRSGDVAASKMLYQMNRLRQMAANFELQRSNSLAKHTAQLALYLYPQQTLQERVIGGAWFAARYGDGLAALLVEQAGLECPGHKVILL
jgi:bacillithiol biosynthesis cysteine-adding enzyme BshC